MSQVQFTVPEYDEESEHVVRRLGAAVVAQWAALPDDVRRLLVEQATFMDDRYQTVQLKQEIEQFIEQHKGWKK